MHQIAVESDGNNNGEEEKERGADVEGFGIASSTLDPDSGFLLTSRSRCSTPGDLTPSGIDLYGDLLNIGDEVRRIEGGEEGGREREGEGGVEEETNIDGVRNENLIVAALLRQDILGLEMNV